MRYEYKIERDYSITPEELEKNLNAFGQNGWMYCGQQEFLEDRDHYDETFTSQRSHTYFIFRRECESE